MSNFSDEKGMDGVAFFLEFISCLNTIEIIEIQGCK
jgi:hypothetical protein